MINPKDIMTHILIPLTIFGLVSALVVDVLVAGSNEILTETTTETGSLPSNEQTLLPGPNDELALEWESYYGGGNGQDAVIAVSDTALRISTGANGGWFGARSALPPEIQQAEAISFSVRFADWNETDRVMILLSSGPDFTDYYGVNLKNYFALPVSGEWKQVVVDRSAFAVIEGAPDWKNVTDIAIRVVPKEGVATRVWFDDLQVHASERTDAVITFTFDDGFDSVSGAKAIMGQYEMRGTAYVIPELIGTEGYMSQVDIDSLALSGWDISGHGKTNLTTLSPVDVDADLANTYAYLHDRGYQGAEHYAFPNGGYNESVQSQVLEYYSSARTIDGFQQPPELVYRENVNAITISNTTPVTEVIAEIDRAIERGNWLILVWHDFNEAPELSYEYHTDDFAWVVDYVAEKEVTVLPYSEAYAQMVVR